MFVYTKKHEKALLAHIKEHMDLLEEDTSEAAYINYNTGNIVIIRFCGYDKYIYFSDALCDIYIGDGSEFFYIGDL